MSVLKKKVIIGIIPLFIVLTFVGIKFSDYLSDYRLDYEETLINSCRENDLDPYLVAAIISQESDFRNINMGANKDDKIGLMQIRFSAAKKWAQEMGLENFTWKDLKNPKTNIKLGTWYLGKLKKELNNQDELIARWHSRNKADPTSIREGSKGYILSVKNTKEVYLQKYPNKLK